MDGLSDIWPSQSFFERNYFFVFFGFSRIHIIFGIRTLHSLGMTKRDFLGTPCPKSNVWFASHAGTWKIFDIVIQAVMGVAPPSPD